MQVMDIMKNIQKVQKNHGIPYIRYENVALTLLLFFFFFFFFSKCYLLNTTL